MGSNTAKITQNPKCLNTRNLAKITKRVEKTKTNIFVCSTKLTKTIPRDTSPNPFIKFRSNRDALLNCTVRLIMTQRSASTATKSKLLTLRYLYKWSEVFQRKRTLFIVGL